jgi:hypothetical protein
VWPRRRARKVAVMVARIWWLLGPMLGFLCMSPMPLWAFAQVLRALWPLESSIASAMEEWAWRHWEAEAIGQRMDAEPVAELGVGMIPESRARPFVVRGLLNGTGSRLLGSYEWLTTAPVADITVDYFSNTGAAGNIFVPDARGRLGEVARRILGGSPEKIATEWIFRRHPELVDELNIAGLAADLLGSSAHVAPSRLGSMLTVPVFLGHGQLGAHARTDLHCEPIGNLALQLGGRKRWTLVAPEESHLVRPTLSTDGRAYFISALPSERPNETFAHVRRWTVETDVGDALWVPTWTWHRVDYLPGVTALAASLFHFRVEQVAHNGLFTALAIPNVIKELVGWKTQ